MIRCVLKVIRRFLSSGFVLSSRAQFLSFFFPSLHRSNFIGVRPKSFAIISSNFIGKNKQERKREREKVKFTLDVNIIDNESSFQAENSLSES